MSCNGISVAPCTGFLYDWLNRVFLKLREWRGIQIEGEKSRKNVYLPKYSRDRLARTCVNSPTLCQCTLLVSLNSREYPQVCICVIFFRLVTWNFRYFRFFLQKWRDFRFFFILCCRGIFGNGFFSDKWGISRIDNGQLIHTAPRFRVWICRRLDPGKQFFENVFWYF